MCTSPITIRRNYPLIGEREYVVPCGKCEECTNKKQAEFGALALHAALKADSLVFITFTYRNEMCPVALSEETVFRSENGEAINREVRVIGFERGCDPWIDSNGVFMNEVRPQFVTNPQVYVSCSLHREDVKNTLKEFRREWKKLSGEYPKLSYAVFGELGEQRGRPHYHGLFFGLTPPMVKMLTDIWNRRFGFTYVVPPNFNRKLSLDEIIAVTRYTSKYISKGVCSRWAHLLPYVEKPRRQSSLNFGDFSQEEISQLSDFIFAATLPAPDLDFRTLVSWSVSCLDGKLSKLLGTRSLFHNA